MENQTLSRKQLYALACVFLFAPLVTLDSQLDSQEKIFVAGYKKYGNFLLSILLIIFLLYLLNIFLLKNLFLSKIISYLPLIVVFFIIFGVIKIFQNKYIFNETQKILQTGNQIVQDNQNIIFDMLIGYNLYDFSKNPSQRYYLKEGVLFSCIFIISGLFIYSGMPKIIFNVLFFFWLFRFVALVAGLDFFPQKVKNFISGLFENNIEQIFAYPKSIFLKILLFFRHQNADMKKLVDFGKLQYSQNGYFYQIKDGKKIYDKFFVLEYIFFTLTFLYFGFLYYQNQKYEIMYFLYILPLIFALTRVLSCYYFKRLAHIPIFFELTNFLFWISKKRTKKQISTNEA